VTRWEPNARGRLEQAALELYVERGYDNTTVAEIAERAGLTERTFFRHFADKREVLFSGARDFQDMLVNAVLEAPTSASPMAAVAGGLETLAGLLHGRRDIVGARQAVIDRNAELRERELIKMASVTSAVAGALHRRGVKEPSASLTAEAGIAAFRVAFARWVKDPKRKNLSRLIRESLDELKSVTAG
jgi:AcrR family transcriptional regulator